jgi:GcvH upstream region-like protein
MLEFFRKYQRYFFIIITIVIVISFSFFGTYSTLSESSFREQVAFNTIDGTAVTRHELDELVLFLSTDTEDKQLYGGAWGPNFLNDGVIKKDFLNTGLAEMLAAAYANELQQDLVTRFEKERRFSLYTHPEARFIGVESVWNYFAPEMSLAYNTLRISPAPLTPEAFKARVALYLMQRQLPPPLLHQVLRYQEKQYNWLTPDANLDHTDLSLFGYHTLEDWFGPRFTRVLAQFIINASLIAEQKGYQVTKTEALAELTRNSDISFQQMQGNPNLGVKNSEEYFHEQLRRLGMDQNMAVKAWQQVLLFRRLFHDLGSSVFVDPLTYRKFNDYALASLEGDLYQLPKPLRLNGFHSLQKFELYIDAVGKRSAEEKAKLLLPNTFFSAEELIKKYPELVQKRYQLDIATVDKKNLETAVSLKTSWNWEVSDKGWERLKTKFPELGTKSAATEEERFTALNALDAQTRSRVDAFARSMVVAEHPEWLQQALQGATGEQVEIGIQQKGGKTPFAGLEDHVKFMQLLDTASLVGHEINSENSSNKADQALSHYTADSNSYYRIAVVARSPHLEVMTFAEADQKGVLDTILERQLEAYYLKTRDADPTAFQLEDKSWKPFLDVKETVANRYFEKTLNSIKAAYTTAMAPKSVPETISSETLATVRLYPYMQDLSTRFKKSPEGISAWIQSEEKNEEEKTFLSQPNSLSEQWKLEKRNYQTTRSSSDHLLDKTELFALSEGNWTQVNAPANGNLNFFHLQSKGTKSDQQALNKQIAQIRQMLSDDVQQKLMSDLLKTIQAKKAISLDYLNQKSAE